MKTFDDLGMHFALFRGPVAHARIDPAGNCTVCGQSASIRFSEACYDCFRIGKVDHVVDTELGMVRFEDARKGLTHGIPIGDPPVLGDYELVPHPVDPRFPDEKWFRIQIASEWLLELLHTPRYHTWQGENWLFCCKRPSVFLGSVPAAAFSGKKHEVLRLIAGWFADPDWDALSRKDFGSATYHVFQCQVCNSFRYHADVD